MAGALDKLSEAGYKMLKDNEIEELILSLLDEGDIRFLKAIPYLIFLYKPDIDKIYHKTKQKRLLEEIIFIARKIFSKERIEITLPDYKQETKFDFEEFYGDFILQRQRSEPARLLLDKEKIYGERNLQMHLSKIFAKKEKYIIHRLLNDRPLSKTESEYYSRKTKKKLNAILNLQDLAKSLLPISPIVNEDLFMLKKYLEEISGKGGYSLERFFLIKDAISLSLKNKRQENLNREISLKDIKNKRINELINKYKEHDFRE